jgi:signal transduction histidine kinase
VSDEVFDQQSAAAPGQQADAAGTIAEAQLRSLIATTQLLERRLAKQPDLADDKMTAPLRTLMSELKRLTLLLEEFRMLARRQQINPQPTSLAAVAADVLVAETLAYAALGIQVQQVFPADLPLIAADSEKLLQVLLNRILGH